MNKTVKKIVSMVVAMTFLLAMTAVPVSFAAIDATPTDTYGWRIDLYKDLNADGTGNTPITALAPNQEAYVQFVLTGMKYLNAAQATLTITNGKFIANDAVATSNAAFENFKTSTALVGTNNLAYETSMTSFGESAVNFAILNPMSAAYPLPDDGVYETTDTTNGTDVVLLTYKIQAAADVSSEKPVSVAVSSPVIQIGELKRGSHTPTAVETENQRNLANVGLPGMPADLDKEDVAVVEENNDDADAITSIDINDGDPLFEEGGEYYFRIPLTNGTNAYLPIIDAAVASADGAYIGVQDFSIPEGKNSTSVEIKTVTLVYGGAQKAITAGAEDPALLTVNVQGAEYRVKAGQTLKLARGVASVDAATILPYIEKTVDGGADDWKAAVEAADITDTNGITFNTEAGTAFDNMATVGTTTTVIPVIDGMTFKTGENNKLTIETAAATPVDPAEYQVKAGQTFTLYLSSDAFDGDIMMEQEYTDGFTGHDVSAKSLNATIDASAIDALLANKDTEVTDQEVSVTVTIGEQDYIGTVKVTTKKALPLEKYMAAADADGNTQEFTINYKGTVDTSAIKFWEQVQLVPGDESTNRWVAYTPADCEIVLSDFDNTVDGSNEVTVSLSGEGAVELDPNTITVIVDVDATYTAKWFNDTVKLVAGTTLEDIKSMITIEADYDGVKEMVKVDPDLLDVSVAGGEFDPNNTTTAQTLTVTYDGKPAGTLAVTLVAAENLIPVSADIEIVGVEILGTLSGTVEVNSVTFTYGLTGDGKVKLMGNVPTTDATYDLEIKVPGFAAASLTVTVAGGEADVTGDAQLIAGEVANAADNAINDADFYAVAASVGTTPAGATAKYDINRDGKIDALDVAAVIANLGTELGAEVTE